jgi:hypothetical protein
MPDNDSEHETEQAPTTEASSETSELAPVKPATESVYAWSVDDTAEVDSDSPRPSRSTTTTSNRQSQNNLT